LMSVSADGRACVISRAGNSLNESNAGVQYTLLWLM